MSASQPRQAAASPILCGTDEGRQLRFDALPLWQGVQTKPGIRQVFPLWLGWDPIGFIRQVTPGPVRNKVIRAYAADDYQFITRPPGGSAWANRLGQTKITTLERYVDSLEGLRVMEIGAGSLFVAEYLLRQHGISDYVAVDPALRAKSSDSRITVIRDYFPSNQIAGRSFDLILAFSCLDYFDDVTEVLKALHRSLSPGGRAILTFPDVGRQFADGDLCGLVHEHLTFLDRAGVEALFSATGFDLLEIELRHDMFYCVIRPTEPAADRRVVDMRSDAVLVDVEKAFQNTVEIMGSRIRAEIAQGMSIAFHGANAGLNNFLYLADLTEAPNVVVFDGDESKAGAYLPACQSAIRANTDPSYGDVDRIYISATSFLDEVIAGLTDVCGIDRRKIAPLFGASPAA